VTVFERILVAVDGSDNALAALELAVRLQKQGNSDLLLLCVYRHYSLLEASMSMVRPAEPENLEESMREYAGGVVERAKAFAAEKGGEAVRGFVKSGPPARTIVGFAKEHEADLIVIGSRGLGDVEGFLLGSVSHKVVGLAESPVLVV
jgi:nucleotide-binding universal stress UspA family protein